jgi:hypothetical protein
VSDRENVLNTLVVDKQQLIKTIGSAIGATANIKGFKDRILSWVIHFFMG